MAGVDEHGNIKHIVQSQDIQAHREHQKATMSQAKFRSLKDYRHCNDASEFMKEIVQEIHCNNFLDASLFIHDIPEKGKQETNFIFPPL